MVKARRFSPPPPTAVNINGRMFRRAADPVAEAIRNDFRQKVDKNTGQPEIKSIVEGAAVIDSEPRKYGAPVDPLTSWSVQNDFDMRRLNDAQYRAINNQYRQAMDPNAGKPVMSVILAGDGYYENRDPDDGKYDRKRSRALSRMVKKPAATKNFIALNRLNAAGPDMLRAKRPQSTRGRIESHAETTARKEAGSRYDEEILDESQLGIYEDVVAPAPPAGPSMRTARVTRAVVGDDWDSWDRNTVAPGGIIRTHRPASARERPTYGEDRIATWVKDQTRIRPQSAHHHAQRGLGASGRSIENWTEWDVQAHTAAGPNNRRSRSIGNARPTSARVTAKEHFEARQRSIGHTERSGKEYISNRSVAGDGLTSRELLAAMAGNAAIATRDISNVATQTTSKVQRGVNSRNLIAAGLNHPASTAPVPGMGPSFRSLAVNRDIALAVSDVITGKAGDVSRPIAFGMKRDNDIAVVNKVGPTAESPSMSHRQFLRNLEKQARQAGLVLHV